MALTTSVSPTDVLTATSAAAPPAAGSQPAPLPGLSATLAANEELDARRRRGERGLTLVPVRIYFSAGGSRAKVELALARGKDLYDKRESIRTRETARDVARELREARR